MTNTVQTLDARGLNCPLPILRTKKSMSRLATGEILEVTATDPGSVKDLAAFCSQTGNEMLSSEKIDGDFIFRIRKA
ncbi:MAG: sulfurtransferase TusA family protein [Pseudomonadota bacterium]